MRWHAGAGALLVVLAVGGCGADGRAAQSAPEEHVTISAAASLRHVFAQLESEFEAAHPGTSLTFNYGSSSSLAEQIAQGAPVDVFAAADPQTMRKVTRSGRADGDPWRFARNVLQVAVPAANTADVRGVRDLARPELVVALCSEQVPCGRAARRALAAAGVEAAPDTLEPDVAALVTKVGLGEVDAALAYRTDVRAARQGVTGIDFPEARAAVNDYLIVGIEGSHSRAGARAFMRCVLGKRGQAVLAEAGFQPP